LTLSFAYGTIAIVFYSLRKITHCLPPIPHTPDPKINEKIIAPEVRVLGNDGSNLGVFPTTEALAMAREQGLDLIEISPNAKPVVARIMSYDKFRYLAGKAEKKERQATKASGVKQVQISAKAASNDLMVKMKKLEEFLSGGHQVEIQMRLRGREKGNKLWAEQKLKDFMAMIPLEYRVVNPPRFAGRGMTTSIMKK
jgi:translation initiation factor IF-3